MKVIDLFAGPGGLGEGFSRAGFDTPLSIECNLQAIRTLRFRKTWRKLAGDPWLDKNVRSINEELISKISDRFDAISDESEQAAWQAELGKTPQLEINNRIDECLGTSEDWVLIGGPPCQAYSLAGRSRMRGMRDNFDDDHRHFLYREYLKIVANFAPPVFVMENVKGVFSSNLEGESAFERIYSDLSNPRKAIKVSPRRLYGEKVEYDIQAVFQEDNTKDTPTRFLIRSEDFGIPQRRHRVILVGIRSDLKKRISGLPTQKKVSLSSAISDLPTLRSKTTKTAEPWIDVIRGTLNPTLKSQIAGISGALLEAIEGNLEALESIEDGLHIWKTEPRNSELAAWLHSPIDFPFSNHEARGHMPSDLQRYFYAASYAKLNEISPKLRDFPKMLLPKHKNVKEDGTAIFNDRFRVQVDSQPSTTITSHISKDGHYYIHPDPLQCRSLTVREAARCQTFPDDYFFRGNRTQQYHQVGNAVPPLLSFKIAKMIKNDIF